MLLLPFRLPCRSAFTQQRDACRLRHPSCLFPGRPENGMPCGASVPAKQHTACQTVRSPCVNFSSCQSMPPPLRGKLPGPADAIRCLLGTTGFLPPPENVLPPEQGILRRNASADTDPAKISHTDAVWCALRLPVREKDGCATMKSAAGSRPGLFSGTGCMLDSVVKLCLPTKICI